MGIAFTSTPETFTTMVTKKATTLDMVLAAIKAGDSRKGSSRASILKYVLANSKSGTPAKVAAQVKVALRKGVEAKKLKMARPSGKGSGAFKVVIDEKPKKVKKTLAKKSVPKKKSVKKGKVAPKVKKAIPKMKKIGKTSLKKAVKVAKTKSAKALKK